MKVIVILAFILYSCSSNTKSKKSKSLYNFNNDGHSVDITTKSKIVKFDIKNDYFKKSNIKKDVLHRESIARVDNKKLRAISNKRDPVTKAIALCYQNKFKNAFKITDKIYSSYKKHPGYWNAVGTCYLLLGKKTYAHLYYSKSRELSKNYSPPENNIGVIYQLNGEIEKAALKYKKASQLSSSVTPKFNMAQLYLKYNLQDNASIIFSRLLENSSRDDGVLNGMGTIALINGNSKEAINYFGKISKGGLVRPEVALNYAIALKKSGNNGLARKVFRNINKKYMKNNYIRRYYNLVERYIGR